MLLLLFYQNLYLLRVKHFKTKVIILIIFALLFKIIYSRFIYRYEVLNCLVTKSIAFYYIKFCKKQSICKQTLLLL